MPCSSYEPPTNPSRKVEEKLLHYFLEVYHTVSNFYDPASILTQKFDVEMEGHVYKRSVEEILSYMKNNVAHNDELAAGLCYMLTRWEKLSGEAFVSQILKTITLETADTWWKKHKIEDQKAREREESNRQAEIARLEAKLAALKQQGT